MMPNHFKAFVVEEIDGQFTSSIKTKSIAELPQGDLLIISTLFLIKL